jgi:hypothetical protein
VWAALMVALVAAIALVVRASRRREPYAR